jgi:plasmid maintenance system killer protein
MNLPHWTHQFTNIRWPKRLPHIRKAQRKSALAALELNGFEPTEKSIKAVMSIHESIRRQEQLAFVEIYGPNDTELGAYAPTGA